MTPSPPVDILLVEDNPHDAEMAVRALRRRGLANRLHHVRDGAAALAFLGARHDGGAPRVVLLDLKLPKVNGLEVLEAIRADARTRQVPVVVVTSSAEDSDVRAAYALGASSYVVKPVDPDRFVEAVEQVGSYWLLVNHPPDGAAHPEAPPGAAAGGA